MPATMIHGSRGKRPAIFQCRAEGLRLFGQRWTMVNIAVKSKRHGSHIRTVVGLFIALLSIILTAAEMDKPPAWSVVPGWVLPRKLLSGRN